MKTTEPEIHGVYLSEAFDLEQLYGEAIRECAKDVVLNRPEDVSDPRRIRFAVCWAPGEDAFSAYPNLSLSMSIGAGVDALVSHPGLGPEVLIARVRDPHQACLMAGFAAHEVLHYERDFGAMMRHAKEGAWRQLPMRAPEAAVIAVLGHGSMGRAVAAALAVLGFSVRVACQSEPDYPVQGVRYFTGAGSVPEAATGADYLVNVLPLTQATVNVLNTELFSKLKHGARLIQIGRGEHLVEADLLSALDGGQLAAATLDVFRTEPLPSGHPFWSDHRLRITPHVASDSTPEIVASQVVETARALRDDAAIRLRVDRNQGY